jgi:hypothetical protein
MAACGAVGRGFESPWTQINLVPLFRPAFIILYVEHIVFYQRTRCYALKSSESKRQYPRRFKMFLDFLKLEGSLGEQAKQFLIKARQDSQWVQDNLRNFIAFL